MPNRSVPPAGSLAGMNGTVIDQRAGNIIGFTRGATVLLLKRRACYLPDGVFLHTGRERLPVCYRKI